MADRLNPGQSLNVGQRLTSGNQQYFLIMQGDGNLVLYASDGFPIWATGTDGSPANTAIMQDDGNFVVYSPGGQAHWATATDGNPGSWIIMQSDGNLVVYRRDGRAIWASGTDGGGLRGKLCGWGTPTLNLPSSPPWADHTFATFERTRNIWSCASGSGGSHPDNPGTRLLSRNGGSRNKARCLGNANSGIIWSVNGLCHQCTNRVLYPAGITVSRARGYTASTVLYGTYGDPVSWGSLKLSCYGIDWPFSTAREAQEKSFLDDLLPGSVIAQRRNDIQEINQILNTDSSFDMYREATEKDLAYNDAIIKLYTIGEGKPHEIMGNDLQLLLQSYLEGEYHEFLVSDLQNAQYELQARLKLCYLSYQKDEIEHGECQSSIQGMIEAYFQLFETLLGESKYASMFDDSPKVLSKVKLPKT